MNLQRAAEDFLTFVVVIISFLSSSSSSSDGLTGLQQWGVLDSDAIVIEAPSSHLQVLGSLEDIDDEKKDGQKDDQKDSHKRTKRQFPSGFQFPQFPAGWPFIHHQQPGIGIHHHGFPSFPGFPTQLQTTTMAPTPAPTPAPTMSPAVVAGTDTCVTRNGFQGRCASFRKCHPYVFSSIEGEKDEFRNPGLAEDLRERAGTCDSRSMPNYFIFRADAQMQSDNICCAGSHQPIQNTTANDHRQFPGINNLFHPQITMRPPWALWSTTLRPATTTTTTMRTTTRWTTRVPQTQRTTTSQSLWPNWPPPFITHPPHHFHPSASTSAPQQWPPQQQPGIIHQQQKPSNPRPPPAVTTPQPVVQPPVSSSCGYSKIVGGTVASKSEFPWLVAIMRNGRQVCGGSLIDSQWVLTAAHCFEMFSSYDVQNLRVQIGDYDIYSHTDGPVTVKGVTKIIKHRGFSQQLLHNDIALMKLDSPVQLGNNGNNNIQPICLTKSGGYEGSTATVAGWGGLYENGPQPAIYRKVNMRVWTNSDCKLKYGQNAPGGITSQMVCAGSPNTDACRGDSGGPLMRNNGGRWEQIGIVSWGIGCGRFPGVYTRVDMYQDWIANHRRH